MLSTSAAGGDGAERPLGLRQVGEKAHDVAKLILLKLDAVMVRQRPRLMRVRELRHHLGHVADQHRQVVEVRRPRRDTESTPAACSCPRAQDRADRRWPGAGAAACGPPTW